MQDHRHHKWVTEHSNATPVTEEKPGGDSKNSLSRVSDGRRPSRKWLS